MEEFPLLASPTRPNHRSPVAIAALSSELANRGLDELHCCKDNGRGWHRGPGTIFVPHGCTAVTGCNNGAETLVCNDDTLKGINIRIATSQDSLPKRHTFSYCPRQ
ncbi:hypothetical protein M7I_8306 [Glarea lozoyensis 74030]|uniref:Uncharacterized protein n=1 Tax=Glarea lozoyensis (strain ATCC 74030 / MF5533) TaxID=1104152 RepID=H0EZN0_GLAL7|nr:hypothetical protein M7I_8306 [Glarea lozoyensis 74030]